METMERDAEYIARQCKFLRKVFGLTQENLANAAGLTVRTIQKVESGKHVPDLQTLRSLARGVGFDLAVFTKPTPEQERRQQEEMERALRKTILVPTLPIKKANDFYSRNREWHAVMINAGSVEADDALELTAAISEWMDDLGGIWGISTASQRLVYATSIAALCCQLEGLGYLTHFGGFRQQHMHNGLVANVALLAFLPFVGRPRRRPLRGCHPRRPVGGSRAGSPSNLDPLFGIPGGNPDSARHSAVSPSRGGAFGEPAG